MAPFAVAGYIAAAYWFTSSTSFANPAVTVGRIAHRHLRRHRARPRCRPFIVAQLVGGALAVALVRYLHPDLHAVDLVVPHDAARGAA